MVAVPEELALEIPYSRVETIAPPRVDTVVLPSVPPEPQLVVAWTADLVVMSDENSLRPPLPSYITQEDAPTEAPAQNTIARRSFERSLTQDIMLSCIEMSSARATPKNLSKINFPL